MDNPIGKESPQQICHVCQRWPGFHQGPCLSIDGLHHNADTLLSPSSVGLDFSSVGSPPSVNLSQVSDLTRSSCAAKKISPITSTKSMTIQKNKEVYSGLPSCFIKTCAYTDPACRIWRQSKGGNTLQCKLSFLTSREASLWREKLQRCMLLQQKILATDGNKERLPEKDNCCFHLEVEFVEMGIFEDLRQPLSRKVPVPSSRINPYRVALIFRILTLAFFLHYRIVNPVKNAYGLWLTSVICEGWFSLSWIIEQLTKWKPIRRETYPERLCFRHSQKEEPSRLACIDVFVITKDPKKEPPLITLNTVLSVLAVDYPAEKVTCYVLDDGASILTFETLKETCRFAMTWVPFCKKFNIEPMAPEYYFSHKVDCTKNTIFPTFVRERRTMKRQYEEFKVRVNSLVGKYQNVPRDGWIMIDGDPWPGNDFENHPGILQILSGHCGLADADRADLPRLVYVSREKNPGYHDNNTAGALNCLVRVSAILTNGDYILNLACNHYVNNSKAFLEAMCFMMDGNIAEKTCFVQFPQRFDGVDATDEQSSYNSISHDVNLKGLDGIQGPLYVGTGCIFNRKALYGFDPLLKHKCSRVGRDDFGCCGYATTVHQDENTADDVEPSKAEIEYASIYLSLKQYFGQSQSLIASIIDEDNTYRRSAASEDLLKESIRVISCGYEENTAWGKEIGWVYGSLTSDILTGLKMHAQGWRSIYCTPSNPAFKGKASINLLNRLNQLFECALGSMEILFSQHCPAWYAFGGRLKLLERIAYFNATIYPLTSIPLVIYCTLPAICLISGKFIIPSIGYDGNIWLSILLLFVFSTGYLEMRWSGIGTEEWWRSQQFWVIGGVSAHLFAVIYAPVKILVGERANLSILSNEFVKDDLKELYVFRWTALLVVPTTIVLINLCAMVAGISSAFGDKRRWSWHLLAKLFLSFMVLMHLHPFLKGLLVRRQRVPTIVVVWSLLLAAVFSMLWIRVDPFVMRFTGPSVEACGIYC